MAGNLIEASSDNVVSVIDATPPGLSEAILDMDTGVLTLVFNEEVNPNIDSSKFTVKSGADSTALGGASPIPANSTSIILLFTDSQTASVKEYESPVLDIASGAVRDLAGNRIAESLNNTLSLVDNPPILVSAVLDEKTVTLTLTFTERIDTDPISDVNPSWLTVTDSENESPVQLTGAVIWPVGDETVRIIPVESQMDQILLHETPDLDILDGAVRDMKQQGIIASDDNVILRADDTVRPKLAAASLDNNVGILTVTFDEPIDHDMVDVSAFNITAPAPHLPVSLESSTILSKDPGTVRIILNNTQLEGVQAETELSLVITSPDAVNDLAGNALAAPLNVVMDVMPLDVPDPSLISSRSHAAGEFELSKPKDLTIAEIGTDTYAVATVAGGSGAKAGVQIINMTDPQLPSSVAFVEDNRDGFYTLADPQEVAITRIGTDTYAVVASKGDNGIQIINITNASDPRPVSNATDGADGFGELQGAQGVAIAEIDSKTYAVVTGRADNGVQIIDITNASDPLPVANMTEGQDGFYTLGGAHGVAVTRIGTDTYAVVAAHNDNGIQIIDITNPAKPSPVSNVTRGPVGSLLEYLDGPTNVAITEIGSKTYAVVASTINFGGVQVIDISNASNPMPASDLDVTYPYDLAIVEIDSGTYIVTTLAGDEAPIANITDPGKPQTVTTIKPGWGQFSSGFRIVDPTGVDTTQIGSKTYAALVAHGSSKFVVVELTNLASPGLSSATFDEGTGTLRITFDGTQVRDMIAPGKFYIDLSKVSVGDGESSINLGGLVPVPYTADTVSVVLTEAQTDTISERYASNVTFAGDAIRKLLTSHTQSYSGGIDIFDSSLCGVSIEYDLRKLSGIGADGISASIPQTLVNAYRTDIAEVRADASAWNADGTEPIPANATEVRVDNGQYWYPMEQNMLITANLEPKEVEPLSFRYNQPDDMTLSGATVSQTIKYMATCG